RAARRWPPRSTHVTARLLCAGPWFLQRVFVGDEQPGDIGSTVAPHRVRWRRWILHLYRVAARVTQESFVDRDFDLTDALELERHWPTVEEDLRPLEEVVAGDLQSQRRSAFTHGNLGHELVEELSTLGVDRLDPRLRETRSCDTSDLALAVDRALLDQCEREILD